ncbi:MAG: glycosyltransferase family 2 protein [Chloroflexi bacterium HGW-Chloroflexi-4]|nr:MAG: glycosyltransferase family 2 protein [Chloroflexi bacterium HGW-Chloroflexi-4]
MKSLAVLLTVHNRKEKTLEALRSLFNQLGLLSELNFTVFLVDDGSVDGTTPAIQKNFPQVNIIPGDGTLYWNQGMRLAFSFASKNSFSHYLWLNNDSKLFPSAVQHLIKTCTQFEEQAIIVGSLKDPSTDNLTYGGVKRTNPWRPLNFSLVKPEDKPISVETMNGNCVLIPRQIALEVGNLDSAFVHGLGDYDYGLRARKLGYSVFIAPEYVGICSREYKQKFVSKSVIGRWNFIRSPLGLPPGEWKIFAQRYAGPFWFIYCLSPYIRLFLGMEK